jgi:hypothetical protein
LTKFTSLVFTSDQTCPRRGPGHIGFRELGPQLFSKGMEKNKNKNENSKTWMILNFFKKKKT